MPDLTTEQMVLIAAAGVFLLWPKIGPFLKSLKDKASEELADDPSTAGRSAVVTELLKLQDAAKRLAKPKASDLIGSAIVELIGKGGK